MAGGTWEKQNKVRPGFYANFKTNGMERQALNSAGTLAIPIITDWGPVNELIKVSPKTDFKEVFGKSLTELIPIREAFKATTNIIVYILNGEGVKAQATSGGVTAKALYGGATGNKIRVTIVVGLDDKVTVKTFFDNVQVDSQEVSSFIDLKANKYVSFEGTLPSADAILTLSGGTTVAPTNESYSEFASVLDTQKIKVLAVPSKDKTIKALMTLKVKEWRDEIGKKVTLVTNDYNEADYEGVVSVKNGIYLEGNEFLEAEEALFYYAAAYAASTVNSLTYSAYPGAVDCERLNHDEIIQALRDGHIVFTENNDEIVIEQDINTFRSFTDEKNQDFRKNKIVREMDIVHNETQYIHSKYFIGKINNNSNGFDLFKKEIIKQVLDPLLNLEAIEPFDASDIVISAGTEKDSNVVDIGIMFVDAMEKTYARVNCK
ncbi:MAG: phage tail sheath subtilisin-like domain-containing protein [Lysinibacillus sp.]